METVRIKTKPRPIPATDFHSGAGKLVNHMFAWTETSLRARDNGTPVDEGLVEGVTAGMIDKVGGEATGADSSESTVKSRPLSPEGDSACNPQPAHGRGREHSSEKEDQCGHGQGRGGQLYSRTFARPCAWPWPRKICGAY